MRKLIVTRGVPGCGKSTWIKEKNLSRFTICPDDIRLLFSAPVLDKDGKYGINQANDKRVWELVYSLVEERMDRGELIVIDATTKKSSDFTKYQQLANKYLYEIACVDFSDTPLELCLQRNKLRPEWKQVPEDIIQKHYEIVKNHVVPKNIKKISVKQEFDNSAVELHIFLESNLQIKDLSSYKKIWHFGDLQGCYAPVEEFFNENGGFKEDEFYIFVGDFLDRGIQNGEVLKWVVKELPKRNNVVCIMGNHERHLVHWVANLECKSKEFENNTLPQILEAGVTKQEVAHFNWKLRDCFLYKFHEQQVIVSHAGIGALPNHNHLDLKWLSSTQFWRGVGMYGMPIDEIFAENEPDWIQIHGHRNLHNLPIQASKNSFNLEGKIEFAGSLRVVSFEKSK